jgi:hypothetical protein
MRPRFAIDSAERRKFDAKSGQNIFEDGFVLVACVAAGSARWKYCEIPILDGLKFELEEMTA